MKKLLHILFILSLFVSLKTFTGCGASEEEEVSEEELKAKDSVKIYLALENGRIHYTKALQFNEQSDSKSSGEEFETTVNQLSKIDFGTLEKHYIWKKDYTELATSVVQDYFTAVRDIPQNSKLFSLAKQLNIEYEKAERKTYSSQFDPEDMPKGNDIPLVKNSAVEDYITYFKTTGRKYMDKWLYRTGKYFNLMRNILKQNNAPEELVYLSMIESGLDPKISSWAGAIGLWQFMPATGSAYGLYYDSNTDDKRDPEKATDAASRHLKDLYGSLGDWYLALASYNAGQGRVNSAISRSGSKDFWTLRDYLPKETRNYVPQYIACALITINPRAYGFTDVEYGTPIEYDRVIIKSQISVSRIAELAETDIEAIRELNSQLLQDITPLFEEGYLIKIPKGSYNTFTKNYERASDFEKYSYKPQYDGNEGSSTQSGETFSYYKVTNYQVEDQHLIISTVNRELVFHPLAPTDELSTVAIKYSVRSSDLRIWNHISYGKYPKTGDTLSVWLTESKYKELFGVKEVEKKTDNVVENKKTDEVKVTEKTDENKEVKTETDNNAKDVLVNKEHKHETTKTEEKKEVTKKEITKKEKTKENKSSVRTYSVKKGDNLALIAEDFEVSVEDIKDWNNLKSDKILVGQKLKIYSDASPSSNKKEIESKQSYTVQEGDNLTMIADKYNVTVGQIKEWNSIKSDVIYEGQVLKLYSDNKTAPPDKKDKKSSKTYTVEEGDNLTSIADNFNVTVAQLKEWNNLKSDVIHSGQVLKLYSDNKTSGKKDKSKTTYYTVKKGDTLGKIADKYDVTIADLKKWNKLKSEEIITGQKLVIKE